MVSNDIGHSLSTGASDRLPFLSSNQENLNDIVHETPISAEHVTILMPEAVTSINLQMPPGSPLRAMNGAANSQIDSGDPEDNPVQNFEIAGVGDQVVYFAQANRHGNDVEAALAVELPETVVDLGEGILIGDLSPKDYIKLLSFMPKLFEDHD